MGTGNKGISCSAIVRITQFLLTIPAKSEIRCDHQVGSTCVIAVYNPKIGEVTEGLFLQDDMSQDSKWRWMLAERICKIVGNISGRIEPNMYAVSTVVDLSGQPHAMSQRIHKGAEPYPLNLAGNMQVPGLHQALCLE